MATTTPTQDQAAAICRRMVAICCPAETARELTAILDAADRTAIRYADRHEWQTRGRVAAKLAEYAHSAGDRPQEYSCSAVSLLCHADFEAIPPLERAAADNDTDLIRARRDAARS
jgi:hypothetical protein